APMLSEAPTRSQVVATVADRTAGLADSPGRTRVARLKSSRVANDRPCNRCAGPYHTLSLRRPPARRSEPLRICGRRAHRSASQPTTRPRVEAPVEPEE